MNMHRLTTLVCLLTLVGCGIGFAPRGPSLTSGGKVDPPGGAPTTTTTPDHTSAAHWFSSQIFFNQSVRNAAVDSQSATLISALINRGGWGNQNRFQIDYGPDVYYVDANTVRYPFRDDGVYMPDSDLPETIPAPATSDEGFESSTGRLGDGGDSHYLAVDTANRKLYEVFRADLRADGFHTDSIVVVWDFLKTYPANLRGDVCTSADAGGLPIAPLLFSAAEVASGTINHAIRFILPNSRIQYRSYVRPATHGTGGPGWATTNGIPYGARLRLKANYPVNNLPVGARVVARAMQEYGMILADGGEIALTAQSDRYSTQKWEGLLGSHDLAALTPSDFDMIEAGTRFNFSSFDCVRAP